MTQRGGIRTPCTAQPWGKAKPHRMFGPAPCPHTSRQPPSHGPFPASWKVLPFPLLFLWKQNFYRVWGLFCMTSLHIIIGKRVKSLVSFSNWNTPAGTREVWSAPAGTDASLGAGRRSWEEPGEQVRRVAGSGEKSSTGGTENLARGARRAWQGTKHGAEPSAAAPLPSCKDIIVLISVAAE